MDLLPNWTMLVSMGIFLVVVLVLNQLLFKPLLAVMEEREQKTSGLSAQAQELASRFDAWSKECDDQARAERRRGHDLAQELRREAMKERASQIAEARSQVEAKKKEAQAQLQSDLEESRAVLRRESDAIAQLIAARVLQREA